MAMRAPARSGPTTTTRASRPRAAWAARRSTRRPRLTATPRHSANSFLFPEADSGGGPQGPPPSCYSSPRIFARFHREWPLRAMVPGTHFFWHRRYAVPEISRFFGIVITMYFNDHDPPHFHVAY